jgi:hypothetical protein
MGWRELRPLQEEAVDPILDGNSCLLMDTHDDAEANSRLKRPHNERSC